MPIPVMVRDTDLGIDYGESAVIVRWLKDVGDPVVDGQDLVEVESAKAVVVIQAPASGILGSILVPSGMEWNISNPVAYIYEPGEPQPAATAELPSIEQAQPERRDESSTARQSLPMTGMRRTIAERMQESWQAAPRVTLSAEADMTSAAALRRASLLGASKDLEGSSISYTAFMVKSVARALSLMPLLNATMEEGEIWLYDSIDIGVAVDVPEGLVVPVVCQADQKDLFELSEEIRSLQEAALANGLQPAQMTGATFTVTNLGMHGVDFFTPIINPPACAILGVGTIKERPMVRDGKIVICPTAPLCLSFDHRVVDGAPAARFVGEVKRGLENPDLLQ